MKILAITQARFGSNRLPGKVLKKINDKTLLQIHLERASKSKKVNKVIVATTFEKEAEEIIRVAENMGIKSFQGSTNDVLDRYYQAARLENPDYVVRITSDCPLVDPEVIDQVINLAIKTDSGYCSNICPPTFPNGMDVEVFKFSELEKAWLQSKSAEEREHVTIYIHDKCSQKNSIANFENEKDYHHFRLTVDWPEDFELIYQLVNAVGDDKGWKKYVDHILANPALLQINQKKTIP
jgi:Spore coat polysaccharide biosynthesis protein F, CMP-KDO synthetase homolog